MMHGYGMGMWGMGFLGMLVFWGIAIAVFVWIARSLSSTKKQENEITATQILENRFAKGEITKKQFTAMKATLSE